MTTALVVDDNRLSADILCSMIQALGVQAVPALGPRAAFLTLGNLQPEIIFLDINMPGLSGFEVLGYLSREPKLKNIPVVVVTSDDSPETEKAARQQGALDVLIKPVRIEEIEEILANLSEP